MTHRAIVLCILAATYLGIAVGRVPGLKLDRTGIALLGAICMVLFGGVSTAEAASSINWPTIFLLFGFFVISAQLQLSGFYGGVARAISARLGHPARFLAVLMAVAGGLSSMLNNDVVCYAFAPIVCAAVVRGRLNPVPYLIGLAVACNVGAAATLVGNPQNMMIGQVAHLGFGSYLAWSIVPVLLSMAAGWAITWALSKGEIGKAESHQHKEEVEEIPYDRVHVAKGLVILALVVALLFTSLPKEVIALTAAGIHLASPKFSTRDLLRRVDWQILVLFMALFVVTGAFESSGSGPAAIRWLTGHGLSLEAPRNMIAATAALSSLIGNSAAVTLLLKVVTLSNPHTAYVLALANSFTGSLILSASVANIIVVQQAQKLGVNISFRDHARIGVPVTVAALGILCAWAAIAA